MPTDPTLSRRNLLAAGTAAGAGALAETAFADPAGRRRPHRHGLIDVHHHVLPPGAPPPLQKLFAGWTPERDVADMDAAGVATAVVLPGLLIGPNPAQNRLAARGWNEYARKLGQDRPGRYGLFASVPMADVDGALAEIAYAYDQLQADGVGIATNYGEAWLGDDRFQPIYEELNRRRAVVFVHPTDAPCCAPARMSYTREGMDGSWIEWPMNTARTIFSLMSSGTLRRHRDIRFVFSHGGGVMPLLVERVAGLSAWPRVGPEGLARYFPDGIEAEFAKLYFECAQACSRTNMAALRSLTPDSQILFGSDYPIFPVSYGAGEFAKLDLTAQTRQAIARGNALALMPRLA